MASYTELCLGESKDIEFTPRGEVAYVLDERRRAALAEVDNAKFSCVLTYLLVTSVC